MYNLSVLSVYSVYAGSNFRHVDIQDIFLNEQTDLCFAKEMCHYMYVYFVMLRLICHFDFMNDQ